MMPDILTEQEKLISRLRLRNGFFYREIADIVGMNEDDVKRIAKEVSEKTVIVGAVPKIYHGKMLKELLGEEGEDTGIASPSPDEYVSLFKMLLFRPQMAINIGELYSGQNARRLRFSSMRGLYTAMALLTSLGIVERNERNYHVIDTQRLQNALSYFENRGYRGRKISDAEAKKIADDLFGKIFKMGNP